MIRFPVSEAKMKDLLGRMSRLGIQEGDFEEKFIRGGGPGGQKINKTSSTVFLRHIPSGLEVRCQESRNQSLNRFLARRLLVEKLEAQIFKAKSETQQRIEKIRRQKRKRSKRAKEKMLQEKHHRSKIKKFRQGAVGRESIE